MNYKSGLLSLMLTGLGQLRNGSLKKGLVFMFAPFLAVVILEIGLLDYFYGIMTFLSLFLIWKIVCIIDAVRNDKAKHTAFAKPWVLILIYVLWLSISFFITSKEFRQSLPYVAYSVPTSSMQSTLYIGDCFISKKVQPEEIKRGDMSVFIYPAGYMDEEVTYIKRCVALPGDKLEILGGKVFLNAEAEKRVSTYQTSYTLKTHSPLSPLEIETLGILEYEKSAIENEYVIHCTEGQSVELSKVKKVSKVELIYEQGSDPMMYPYSLQKEWNADNYGPFVIPQRGFKITLNDSMLGLYEKVILDEGGSIDNSTYTFTKDYFFMLGDNRKRSADSRYWGFVPEENIISKPLYIYWAKDKSRIGMDLK
jgi:signal peptidase I